MSDKLPQLREVAALLFAAELYAEQVDHNAPFHTPEAALEAARTTWKAAAAGHSPDCACTPETCYACVVEYWEERASLDYGHMPSTWHWPALRDKDNKEPS